MNMTSQSLAETKDIAREFVSHLSPRENGATVVALIGDLGAGKTAFSQAVGEALGVRDPIQSPTFLIEKIYEIENAPWQHLIHIDAYRLEDERELKLLGWETIAARRENLILVEWADKIPGLLPPDAIRVRMTGIDETTRTIDFA